MKVLFLYPNLQLMQIVPPSIASLSSYLKDRKVEVDLFDTTLYKINERSSDEERIDTCQVRPFKFSEGGVTYKDTDINEDFIQKIESFKPDIIGISANDFTHIIADNLIKGIKQKYPHIHIILGGIFATFFPDYAIQNPDIDSICIGEGFNALYELCQKIENNEDITTIPNLWVKQNGQIYKNPLGPPIDIESLSFDDFSLFEEKRFHRPMQGKMVKVFPIWIDLGCPFNCKYCVAPSIRNMYKNQGYNNYFRTKSVDHLIREIDYVVKLYNPNYLYFSTETFFARPDEHIEAFANYYKEKFNIPFWCETRIETVNIKRALLLKSMNCNRLSIGLESGNEYYRNNILNKGFSNKEFQEKIKILQDVGIDLTINNIVGLPDETREMIFDSINLNRSIINDKNDITTTVTTFVPCGGSSLQKYCIEKGYFNLDAYLKDPQGSFHKGAHLTMPQITKDQVRGLLRTFPMYVKMPEEMFPQIKIAEGFDEEGNKKFHELKEIYWEKYFKKVKVTNK
jgi:anaerobic magnesium-protoporphyrin IX monomethyl ester cyclase